MASTIAPHQVNSPRHAVTNITYTHNQVLAVICLFHSNLCRSILK